MEYRIHDNLSSIVYQKSYLKDPSNAVRCFFMYGNKVYIIVTTEKRFPINNNDHKLLLHLQIIFMEMNRAVFTVTVMRVSIHN